jgi:hypothetical protein
MGMGGKAVLGSENPIIATATSSVDSDAHLRLVQVPKTDDLMAGNVLEE